MKAMKVKDIKVGMQFKSLVKKEGNDKHGLLLEEGIATLVEDDGTELPFKFVFYTETGIYIDHWYLTKKGLKKALRKGWLVPIEEDNSSQVDEVKAKDPEELGVRGSDSTYSSILDLPDRLDQAELDEVDRLMKQYPEGTKVRCIGDSDVGYIEGYTYRVGMDKYGDYGVLDELGICWQRGCMSSPKTSADFNPQEWEIIDPHDGMVIRVNHDQCILAGQYVAGVVYKLCKMDIEDNYRAVPEAGRGLFSLYIDTEGLLALDYDILFE